MISAAGPSRFAALCSVATYASDKPSTAATTRPRNPSCRSAASAMFRITTSPAAYSNSTTRPAVITHRPSCSCMRRSRGSGMPSRIAATAADIPLSYQSFKKYAQESPDKTACHRLMAVLSPEIWVQETRGIGRRSAGGGQGQGDDGLHDVAVVGGGPVPGLDHLEQQHPQVPGRQVP